MGVEELLAPAIDSADTANRGRAALSTTPPTLANTYVMRGFGPVCDV
jgi:hypothetical protein